MKSNKLKKTISIIALFILSLSMIISSLSFAFGVSEGENISPTLRIGFDPSLPPYQFYHNGEYQGFFIDLMHRISDEIDMDIELIPMPLNVCLDQFNERKIDMILGMRYNNALDDTMNFSDSLVTSTVSIIMLNEKVDSIKNLLGVEPLIIAIERDSVEFEFVKNIKKANFNQAFNQENVVELLMMKRADLMIGVRHVAQYILDENNLSDQYSFSNTYETPIDYYLGVSPENKKLLNQINATIRTLKINGEYELIYNQWLDDKNIENQKRTNRLITIMALAILSAMTIAAIAGLIGLKLKQKIKDKTKELSITNLQLENKIIEIRNTNELKNLIFESSPRSIAIFDNHGIVLAMNAHAQKICGLRDYPDGQSIYELTPLNQMLENNIENVLIRGESYSNKEFEFISSTRKWFYRYVIYPLSDYENKTRGAIITIEDITDEKILKEQVVEKEKNRELIRIISGIAHEIRNPLTSIKAYVELLPRKRDNLEFQKQIVAVVPKEVERVNKLIENLIDYVKPKTRNIECVKVVDLVESCVLLFQPSLSDHNVKLNQELDNDLRIAVDKNQIKQVLINLILNALDAVLEMREFDSNQKEFAINVETTLSKRGVTISVSDNGIGMTSEELKDVFELFYTTKPNGSGIGLPLSKQILEENDGYIEIESEKYVGTKIAIFFPGDAYEKQNSNS